MFEELRTLSPLLPAAAGLLTLLVVAIAADLLAKRLLVAAVHVVAERSRVTWDDVLVEYKVFSRLAKLVPALIVISAIGLVPDLPDAAVRLIGNVATGYLILMLTLCSDRRTERGQRDLRKLARREASDRSRACSSCCRSACC